MKKKKKETEESFAINRHITGKATTHMLLT